MSVWSMMHRFSFFFNQQQEIFKKVLAQNTQSTLTGVNGKKFSSNIHIHSLKLVVTFFISEKLYPQLISRWLIAFYQTTQVEFK